MALGTTAAGSLASSAGSIFNRRVRRPSAPVGTSTGRLTYPKPGPYVPDAPAAPQTFKWTPGQLDAQGENELADARQALQSATGMTAPGQKVGQGVYDVNLQRALHQTAAQRVMAQQAANQGEQRADSNAAARGIYRSGIRLANRGEVNAQLMRQMADYGAADANANQDYERFMGEAISRFIRSKNVTETNAGTRAWNAWIARYGGN